MSRTSNAAGLVLLAVFALVIESCATIDANSPGICGNAVIDRGAEDCDGFRLLGMPCRAPGAEGECRFDCTESKICAVGFGCGNDGICRAPSGKFELALQLDEDAVTLRAIALDDDDVPDLLVGSTGDPVALFLRDDFAVDLDVDLRTPVGAALIASNDLTGDEIPELAFPSGRGIQVLRGGDREFSGTAYATFTIPPVLSAVVGTIDADTTLAGAEPVVLIQFGDPPVTYTLLADPNIIAAEVIKALGETANPLPLLVDRDGPTIDAIVGGQLDPTTSCDELVLAFRNDDRVVIATPCTQTGVLNGVPFEPDATVDLDIGMLDVDLSACDIGPTPFPVDRAFVLDVDGDGQDDILVTPEVTGAPVPACVAYGPVELENVTRLAAAKPLLALPYSEISFTLGERALAAQRMNLDDELDVITSMGIFLSADSCPQGFHAGETLCDRTPGMPGTHVFAEAVLGDFNGDARLDVAAAADASDLLFVYLGQDDDTFAEFHVEPDGDPRSLVAGDFDGDGVDDVCFADVCSNCEDSEVSDAIVVSFGAVAGGPAPPQSFGKLGRIRQILVSSFPEPAAALDGAADLGVLFSDSSNPNAFRFATLFGSTSRELQAPFVIVKGESRQEQFLYRPTQVLIGEFAQPSTNEPRKDIAAFAYLDEVGLDPKLDMRICCSPSKARQSSPRRAAGRANRSRCGTTGTRTLALLQLVISMQMRPTRLCTRGAAAS